MKRLSFALATIVVLGSVFLAFLPHNPTVIAQLSWTDTINLYPDIHAVYNDFRRVMNNETTSVDVNVQLAATENIHLLKFYKLSANGTDFIVISEGAVLRANATYEAFGVSETLLFDVEATGVHSLGANDTVTIGVTVEFWSTIYIPWDVTGDGYVGIDDIVAVAEHFGQDPTHPDWDSKYDITEDNYVGIDDIVEVAEHFGESI